jgi:hypothetical protein
MNPILSTGVLIGVLCGLWTFIMGFTGWFKDPVLMRMFFVVIVLEIAGLVVGLRQTAALGRAYGGQVLAGTMMAIVAGVIIIASSLLFTTVAFPDYVTQVEDATRASLLQQGKTESEVAEALRVNAASTTPMAQAMSGFLGTLVTGILASAVIAIFVRAKSAPRSPLPANRG